MDIENPETGEASADKNTGTGSVDKGKTNVKKEEEKHLKKVKKKIAPKRIVKVVQLKKN
mgnify:CR=1 FL=1